MTPEVHLDRAADATIGWAAQQTADKARDPRRRGVATTPPLLHHQTISVGGTPLGSRAIGGCPDADLDSPPGP
jgi:hypothetical protein